MDAKKISINKKNTGDKVMEQAVKRDRLLTVLYLLIFLIVASSIALAQPLNDTPPVYANAPDEHARYLIPKFICEHGTLPTAYNEEVRIPGYGSSYALYGILPYIFMGYVMRFVSLFTDSELYLLYSARFVNVIQGVAMAFVVRLLSRRIFDDDAKRTGVDWLFCFLVMFMPQSVFLHTYVNTDSMALLATALILYALVRIYQEGFHIGSSAVLCIGVIFCTLSYYNAYSYILSALLLCLAYFWQGKGKCYDWKNMLRWAVPVTAVILIGAGWWFLRNYILYDGDLLGFRTANEMKELYAVDEVNPLMAQTYQQMGYTVGQMIKETDYLTVVYASFVGTYGSLSIYANIWIYRIYKIFIYGGLIAFIMTIPFYRERHEFKRIFFHVNLIFCILMSIFLAVYYAYTSDFQAQGRYMMPILVPLMLYAVKGFERLMALVYETAGRMEKTGYAGTITRERMEQWFHILVMAAMLVVIVVLLWMVYGIAMPIYSQFLTVIN